MFWHRIDKDVLRCDRNLAFFAAPSNLEKLRNVITTYVWDNLDVGYMQVRASAFSFVKMINYDIGNLVL